MMEATYRQLLAAAPVLGSLLRQKMPPKAAYNIAKIIDRFNVEASPKIDGVIQGVRSAFELKEGEKVPDEKRAEFTKAVETALEGKLKMEIGKLKLSDFGTNVAITPEEIVTLEFLIEEE